MIIKRLYGNRWPMFGCKHSREFAAGYTILLTRGGTSTIVAPSGRSTPLIRVLC
jgi:hypothetical protein